MDGVTERKRETLITEAGRKLGGMAAILVDAAVGKAEAGATERIGSLLCEIASITDAVGLVRVCDHVREMRNAFALLGSHEITASPSTAVMFVDAAEELGTMLVAHRGGKVDVGMDSPAPAMNRLRAHAAAMGSGAPEDVVNEGRDGTGRGANAPTVPGFDCRYQVTFTPGAHLAPTGICPVSLLAELGRLGRIVDITMHTADIPPLGEVNPERYYMWWELIIETDAGESGIRRVFDVVGDVDVITVSPALSIAPDAAPVENEAESMSASDILARLGVDAMARANELGKRIDVIPVGGRTALRRHRGEALYSALHHIVANAVEHGIELPAVRLAAGKSEVGVITLSARQAGDSLICTVRDDGAGVSIGRIRETAVARGQLGRDDQISIDDGFAMLFRPGFTLGTGAGCGLVEAKRKIESLGGSIRIDAVNGRGATISIGIPLAVSMIESLVVRAANQTFTIPVASVEESFRPAPGQVSGENRGEERIDVGGRSLRMIRLAHLLVPESMRTCPTEGIVIIVSRNGTHTALAADEIVGQERVRVKPLGASLPKVPGITGGAILDNGQVALAVDLAGMCEEE